MTAKNPMAALTLSLLLVCLIPTSGVAAGEEAGAQPDDPTVETKTIKMVATNWKWSPDVIRVKRGTRLRIEFESYDASHSFVLKAYRIKVPLPEGRSGEVEFVVDRAGEFPWRCGRPCGDGCAKMRGKLIVEE